MDQTTPLKDIVIIYHDQCRDGFGAAYAAWKVFGENASYIPRRTGTLPPPGLVDKEVYIVDYSYPKEILEELKQANKKLVVIDHHKTAEEAVSGIEGSVFDLEHSGAVLAWQYFHPDTPVPELLRYIEDHDLWKFELPHTREFGAALGEYDRDFATWERLDQNLDERHHFNQFIAHGETIARHEDKLVERLLEFREPIDFEGQRMYAVNVSRVYRSILGNKLAELNASEGRTAMAVIYYRYQGAVHCSLRSIGNVDVSAIAQKYGGGGHPNAASFRVDSFSDLPFTFHGTSDQTADT